MKAAANFSNLTYVLNDTIRNLITDKRCQSLIGNVTVISDHTTTWFQVLLLPFGVIGIFANYLVIRAIVVLGQNQNQSIRLLMYLSMVDILNAVTNILRFIFANFSNLVTCHVAGFLLILGTFSIYSSIYMFAMTAIDRFFKVHYLEDYQQTFTPVRFRITLAWYAIITIIQTVMTVYFSLTHYIGYGSSYTTPITIVVILVTTILYAKSTLQLRRYKRLNENLAENIQNIIKITQIYHYLFAIYPVYVLTVSVLLRMKILAQTEEIITKQIATLVPCMAGSINAIYFFLINKEAQDEIKLYWRYLKRTYFQSLKIGDEHELQEV